MRQWEESVDAYKVAAVVCPPRDWMSVRHVYTYILPIFADGSSALQLRDRPLYSVGLFGGEVELWDPAVRFAMAKDLGAAAPAVVLQSALRELHEEAGIDLTSSGGEVRVLAGPFVSANTSPRSGWRSMTVLYAVTVPSIADVKTWMRTQLPRAKDWGTETLGAVPLPRGIADAAAATRAFTMNKMHSVYLHKLADALQGTRKRAKAAAAARACS